ncbi:MAG: urea ABC transporter permease subunit UrtB [Alcanivorax sp.]|jgi:urea transport system permease protein|uniref:urea ABC transporter permease subunit UrtB n=1 Tax=Alloalcanivorax venustensis TaxID=172371 RepID=UPI000C8C1454|nr:urea ABC transporter permease subunit UrtB [Alloalcanivorax venustensis]MAD71823.1 urea ABC transporter permease subunit UrtB [Alcanivorax sp.]HIK75819.1 urea ABC transporter permease subunit UrtB [Alcanivorax sp.]
MLLGASGTAVAQTSAAPADDAGQTTMASPEGEDRPSESVAPGVSKEEALRTSLAKFKSRDFDVKAEAIETIARSGHERGEALLQALLDRELLHDLAGDRIVLGKQSEQGWALRDPISEEDVGSAEARAARPVIINNRLRQQIRDLKSVTALANPNPLARREAAQRLVGNTDPVVLDALRARQAEEANPLVKGVIDTALNIAVLRDPASQLNERLNAIDAVAGSLEPAVRNVLRDRLAQSDAAAERNAADRALKKIDLRTERYETADTLFFGLSLGSVLLLAAIGLAITFGVMGVINMAHGELIMLGAYTTFVVQQIFPDGHEWSLLVALPAAFLVSAVVGIVIERGVIRFLYGRPLETLLATFGVSLILQQAVRVIFSPLNRSVVTPEWMSGALQINPIFSLTYNRLYIIVFALIVFFALQLVLKKTRLGLQVRAVSQNRGTARAMGIRSERVNALTFGLGSGIAGIAGVALAQLTNVGPNLGHAYIIDSFMVVVFGGVGNLWGTLTAAFSLGIANKIIEPMAGAVLAKIMVLVFIILFIQRKPRGLFPQRGRAAEE